LVKRSGASVCEHAQGDSTVSWKKVDGDVMFSVGQSVKAGKWWTAIGVGQSMARMISVVTASSGLRYEVLEFADDQQIPIPAIQEQ
ncbi:hypothetical protein OESDEN_17614, partial [Oesophagostomum dentatum]